MKKRILLVEDDFLQAPEICAALQTRLHRDGIETEIVVASSEAGARSVIMLPLDGSVPFDLFIVDLMLPWTMELRDDDIDAVDPRALSEGPLKAGLRVIEFIRYSEGSNMRATTYRAPIILYTVAPDTRIENETMRLLNFQYLEKQLDGDGMLADIAAQLLSGKALPL